MIRGYANRILYENNHEAQEVWRVTQPELDVNGAEVMRIFNNTRVSLADIEGVEQWERALNIFPDLARDTFEERRDRVLDVLRTSPPFTENWLRWQLSFRFPYGGVSYSLARLVLRLYMDLDDISMEEMPRIRRYMRELVAWFRTWVSANLLLMPLPTIRRTLPTRNLYIGGHFWRVATRRFKEGM